MQNLSCENEFYVHDSKNPFHFNSFELSRDLTEQRLRASLTLGVKGKNMKHRKCGSYA